MSHNRTFVAAGTARLLMSRLRELMASEAQQQERLERVVQLIATTMVADVCSIYVRSGDNSLVLMATEGLLPEAIGRTRLAENEGLVGLIASSARAKRLSNAPKHPRFSYRPETGEDPYHGFLGVPILRGGRVLGVLVVQNRTERNYDDEEMESLQTIAMVLAEIVASALDEGNDLDIRELPPGELKGRTLNEGVGLGTVHLHDPIVSAARFFSQDPEAEGERLDAALADLRKSIDTMLNRATPVLFGESRDVLETYRLFAHDPSWETRLHDAIQSGLSAEAAVDRTRREHRARLQNARDAYLRERLHDFEDLENRLLRHLSGEVASDHKPVPGSILVASRLGPAELLEYRDCELAGVILEEGGAGSHAAIVARAIGIPAIGDAEGIVSRIEQGDQVIVDADWGLILIRPTNDVVETYRQRILISSDERAEYAKLTDLPATTKDGVKFNLFLNAGLSFDLDHLDATGAEGVGLFRTEFQFMSSQTVPTLDEQAAFYEDAMRRAGTKPMVFRTLDLGGDKVAPFMGGDREENPALGWRALRLALDRPYFFRRQLRALIRASKSNPLRLMFPMVCSVEEFVQARELVDAEIAWAKKFNRETPSQLRVGAMVETPSFAFSIEALKGKVDFLSVGTNDLMQFFFAADRENKLVSERYDLLSPPALRLMKSIVDSANRAEIPISICGEAAGRPVEALALACLGYRRLSMQGARIGPMKRLLRGMDFAKVSQKVNLLIDSGSVDLRKELLKIIQQSDIQA
ncbi:phosphoenolpyruvate--protein phosphotransferase [Hirschia baltica]|uniref:phosphoenolpyruvate--protein phosphotransferase n=1 Tax=Hirschia baltica (strain ATCC 49814 / DSM 5838 / IFAM 1418) TaxID=582402 RepID=C6XPY3_HIRBI|nr:phosphoenolpyruvate--protein phosphotransferase [Hirschia baltica]ACT58500.1 PTSINtr with GAF domain, PtsP [Hirschia baltica ATCC 49814]